MVGAMTVRITINGFGGIHRLVLRALRETQREDVEIAAINDPARSRTNAHLLR
jgi:glyceraldehyde 3-phosphate dehydrogenase